MKWSSIQPWLGTVFRVVLGGIWLWASLTKIGDPRGFTQAVRAYQATPEWLSQAIGYGLPVLELAVGLVLIFGVITRVGAGVSAALLVVFSIGIVQAAARGIKLDCGCFGGGGTTANTHYTLDILRDIGLLLLAVFLLVWPMTRLSIDERLARHDYVPPPSAKRLRTPSGKAKYDALLATRRREARIRTLYLTVGITAAIVLISVIGIGVQSGRARITGETTATNASAASGVTVGRPNAKATVDVYEDFQCPICQQFETSAGSVLDNAINDGRVKANFHMMAFLDASSNGNRYSSRAANAGYCASDVSPQVFLKYHDYLYRTGVQPAEGSNGRSDADLVTYARAIGLSGSDLSTFQTCVQTEQHKALVQAVTDQASKNGVNGTPTVFVNGKPVDATKAALSAAIVAAAGAPPSATPSPYLSVTPSASGSSSASSSGSSTVLPSSPAAATP